MKKKRIKFETERDEKLEMRIIRILWRADIEARTWTFMKLAGKLGLVDREGKMEPDKWRQLRLTLWQMGEEGLIEERHFEDGIVDYSIENKGIERIRK